MKNHGLSRSKSRKKTVVCVLGTELQQKVMRMYVPLFITFRHIFVCGTSGGILTALQISLPVRDVQFRKEAGCLLSKCRGTQCWGLRLCHLGYFLVTQPAFLHVSSNLALPCLAVHKLKTREETRPNSRSPSSRSPLSDPGAKSIYTIEPHAAASCPFQPCTHL